MGMIKCPDCEQSISSNAKHCIHCGCIFQVCPECEAVLAGQHKVCPECGFQLMKDPPPAPKVENEKSLLQWYEQAKINNSFITSRKLALFLYIVAFLLFAYALVGTYMWAHEREIAETLFLTGNFEETFSSRMVLYIIGAVLWVSAKLISEFGPLSVQRNFQVFASVNKLNLPDLVDKEFKAGLGNRSLETLENRVDAIRLAILATQQEKDVFIAEKDRQNAWFSSIASMLFTIPCCIFFIANTKVYMTAELFDVSLDFEDIQHIWLPIAAIVLNIIINACKRSNGYDEEAWMTENLPQHMDDYKHYVVNFMDVYIDRTVENEINKS